MEKDPTRRNAGSFLCRTDIKNRSLGGNVMTYGRGGAAMAWHLDLPLSLSATEATV